MQTQCVRLFAACNPLQCLSNVNIAGEAHAGLSVAITKRILNHGGHEEHGGSRETKYRKREMDSADSIATSIQSFLRFEFSVNSVVETVLVPIHVPVVSFLKVSSTTNRWRRIRRSKSMSVSDHKSTQPDFTPGYYVGRKKWATCGLVLMVSVLAIGVYCWPEVPVLLPAGVSETAYNEAKLEFVELYHREPNEADVMMTLAEAAVRNDEPEMAVACFERVPSEHIRYGASARLQEAEVLLRSNHADRAEASFRTFLQLADAQNAYPQDDVRLARDWLVFLLAVELRFEDRKAILHQIIQDRQFDAYDAKQFYFPTLLIWQSTLGSSRLRDFLEQAPTSRPLLIAQARYLVGEGKLDAADELLKSLRQQYPDDPDVTAASLECFYEQVNWKEFDTILSAAPAYRDDEPWLLTQMRAEFAAHSQDWTTAETCFRQVLKVDPANPTCHMGLAKALYGLGRTEERKVIQQRSLTLARIRVNLSAVDNTSATAARALAQDARKIQMLDAAESFEYLAEQMERGAR